MRIFTLFVMASLLSTAALADVMELISDERNQAYSVSTEDLNGTFRDSTTNEDPPASFSDWDFQTINAVPNWEVEGSHFSTVSGTSLFAEGSASGTTGPNTSDYFLNWATATNLYQITFDIDVTTTFDLQAVLAAPSGFSNTRLEILRQGSSEMVYSAVVTSGTMTIDEQVILDRGTGVNPQRYTFRVQSSVSLSPFVEGDSSAWYTASLTAVPAPSALGVLGISGLVVTRRRR